MINRLQFLQVDIHGKQHPLRPPWAEDEGAFLEHCNSCGACITACPEKILEKGRGGYPQINFQYGECTFCKRCVEQCPNQSLQETRTPPWHLKAHINEKCLTQQQVICYSCRDSCEHEAILFAIAKVSIPTIDFDKCNGCGACYQSCPVTAIMMKNL